MNRLDERRLRARDPLSPAFVALLVAGATLVAPTQAQHFRRQSQSSPAAAPRAYVTNAYSSSVSVIDTSTNSVVASIPVGTSPGRLSISADGTRAYVPNAGTSSVSVINTATNTVVATIAVNSGPAVAAVTPNGARVYVGGTNGLIGVIDTALNTTVSTFSIGAPSTGTIDNIVFSPDGSRAYALWGSLVVIDTATNSVQSSIYAGNSPTCLAISPNGSRLYVGAQFGYGAFSFYGTVAAVDAATQSVTNVMLVWGLPMSIAITPNGSRAYVATPYAFSDTGYGAGYLSSPWVLCLDLTTNALSSSFSVGSRAGGVAITPDGSRVYVTVPITNSVKFADTATNTVLGSITVGTGPNGVAIKP